jgi:hypothetical protein
MVNKAIARGAQEKVWIDTEKCIWETSKKMKDLFYMKSRFNGKKCNHAWKTLSRQINIEKKLHIGIC